MRKEYSKEKGYLSSKENTAEAENGMSTFLHVGHNKSIRSRDIVGIFDMDNSTVSGVTRNFLSMAQKNGEVINATDEIPKSYILICKKKERKPKVIVSQLAVQTLNERLKRKI